MTLLVADPVSSLAISQASQYGFVGACVLVLGVVVIFLYRENSKERTALLAEIKELHAQRIRDTQEDQQQVIAMARSVQEALVESVHAMQEMRASFRELSEELREVLAAKEKER